MAQYENAKQVAVRDALHTKFVQDLSPGMAVESYNTEFIDGVLFVWIYANFAKLPTMATEKRLAVKIGPRSGVTNI